MYIEIYLLPPIYARLFYINITKHGKLSKKNNIQYSGKAFPNTSFN